MDLPLDLLAELVVAAPLLRETCKGFYGLWRANLGKILARAEYGCRIYRGFDLWISDAKSTGAWWELCVRHDYHGDFCRIDCSRNVGNTVIHMTAWCEYDSLLGRNIMEYVCNDGRRHLQDLGGIMDSLVGIFAVDLTVYVGGREELNYYVDYDYSFRIRRNCKFKCLDKPAEVSSRDAAGIGRYLVRQMRNWVDPSAIPPAEEFEALPGAHARRDCSGDVHEYASD